MPEVGVVTDKKWEDNPECHIHAYTGLQYHIAHAQPLRHMAVIAL